MYKKPSTTFERNAFRAGDDCVVGIDEVGMGCLAGPVVVCAVALQASFFDAIHRELAGVRDSKLLSVAQRENLAERLAVCSGIVSSVAVVSPRDVDRYNVLHASHRGMKKAIERVINIMRPESPRVLVDGNRSIPDIAYPQRSIVGGDRRVFLIACASILAKVHRDALMVRASLRYPGYGFEHHKGYGTVLHYRQLAIHGPSPLHRRSFRGVAS